MRRVLRRIGTPDAISWPGFWLTFLAASFGNILTNVGLVPVGLRLLVIVVGEVVLWAPLLVALLLLRRDPERSRPAVVLTALFIGLAARTYVISVIIGATIGPEQAKWSLRFVGGLVNIVPVFMWTAFIVNAMRERRRQIAVLEAFQADLEHSVELVSDSVVQRNQETVERVRTVLVGELASLDAGDALQSLAALQRTASDVVRPLSHELAQGLPDLAPPATPVDPARISWSHVIDEAASGTPFRPVITGLLMCLPIAGGVLIAPTAVPSAVLSVVTATIMFALANVVVRPALMHASLGKRVVIVIAAAVVAAVVSGTLAAWTLSFTSFAITAGIGVVVAATIIGLGAAIITALGRDRDQVIGDLQASSHAVERNLVRWRQLQWFQQKALSRALHGPVQTAVNAAAIRLDAAMQEGPVPPEVIEQVRAALLGTLDVLNEPEMTVADLTVGLARVTGTWEGICDVRLDVDEAAAQALQDDAALRSCVLDIVTEAVGNTVRHGGATVVDITANADPGDRTVRILVDSNGAIPKPDAPKGLGTQLLDDCSLTWSRGTGPRGPRLDVLLPST